MDRDLACWSLGMSVFVHLQVPELPELMERLNEEHGTAEVVGGTLVLDLGRVRIGQGLRKVFWGASSILQSCSGDF